MKTNLPPVINEFHTLGVALKRLAFSDISLTSGIITSVVEMYWDDPPSYGQDRPGWMEGENVKIKGKYPQMGRLIVQEHNADRAGRHRDYRLLAEVETENGTKEVALSWVDPRKDHYGSDEFFWHQLGLPRVGDHTVEGAEFEGEIEEGEYGAGTVDIVKDEEVLILKLEPAEVKFATNDGDRVTLHRQLKDLNESIDSLGVGEATQQKLKDEGISTVGDLQDYNQTDLQEIKGIGKSRARKIAKAARNKGLQPGGNPVWFMAHSDFTEYEPGNKKVKRLDKQKSTSKEPDPEELESPVAEVKRDGANVTVHYDKWKRPSVASHRISKSGHILNRTYNFYPWLSQQEVPENTTIQGEMVFVDEEGYDHPNILAGLMNANPITSIENQEKLEAEGEGEARFVALDITEYEGEDVRDEPYRERRKLLEKIAQDNDRIEVPEQERDDMQALAKKVQEHGDEGIVIKDEESSYDDQVLYKRKVLETYDLEIKDFTEATEGSKYEDEAIGAIVAEGQGVEANVGTGLTDWVRKDMYKNPDKYKGATIEVACETVTGQDKCLKPRLVRFHPGKNIEHEIDAGEVNGKLKLEERSKGLNPDDPEGTMWAILKS